MFGCSYKMELNLMLSTALVLCNAFDKFAGQDPYYTIDLSCDNDGGGPDEDDCDNISRFVKFLGYFYELP